ncbi:CbrC family protein, partial [Pseudomonas aeruginosa]|nr:CbrC family protein [Pseudomonas aeruginosa]
MNLPLPHFRYHPEPLASGSIETSAATCQCCGKARGYVYTGSPYSRHELPP